MAIKYFCRHCSVSLGEIDNPLVTEAQLGLQFLTPAERRDIITYNSTGDISVHVICDYCREALEANPELSLIENPLQ